jgi:hypothetical protein
MGHCINALIGTPRALSELAERFGAPAPTELEFGLVILPLDEDRLDALATSTQATYAGFTYLTPAMGEAIAGAAMHGALIYIETEYFGGTGGQAAALIEGGGIGWLDSETDFPEDQQSSPAITIPTFLRPPDVPVKSPINRGLAALGVPRDENRDEFDRIGLVRFRSLEALGFEYDD